MQIEKVSTAEKVSATKKVSNAAVNVWNNLLAAFVATVHFVGLGWQPTANFCDRARKRSVKYRKRASRKVSTLFVSAKNATATACRNATATAWGTAATAWDETVTAARNATVTAWGTAVTAWNDTVYFVGEVKNAFMGTLPYIRDAFNRTKVFLINVGNVLVAFSIRGYNAIELDFVIALVNFSLEVAAYVCSSSLETVVILCFVSKGITLFIGISWGIYSLVLAWSGSWSRFFLCFAHLYFGFVAFVCGVFETFDAFAHLKRRGIYEDGKDHVGFVPEGSCLLIAVLYVFYLLAELAVRSWFFEEEEEEEEEEEGGGNAGVGARDEAV